MSEPGRVRRRRSRGEVEALVAEFEASGLMRESFCRQWALAVGMLDKYRRRVHDGHLHEGLCFLLNWFRQAVIPMAIIC